VCVPIGGGVRAARRREARGASGSDRAGGGERSERRVSIRWKILIVVFAMTALFATTAHVVQRAVVMPSFEQLERDEAMKDLRRAEDAVHRDVEMLTTFCRDWGAWDELYNFMSDRNDKFAKENLITETFANNRLNLLCLVSPDGKLVWGQARDSKGREIMDAPKLLEQLSHADHPLVRHDGVDSQVAGLLMTEKGPMLVASRPSLTGQNQGPVHGAVIMGRLLDEASVAELVARVRVPLDFWSIPDGQVPPEETANLGVLENSPYVVHTGNDEQYLHVHSTLKDIYGKPALLVRAKVRRSITLRGDLATRIATAMNMVSGVVVMLVIWYTLRRMVIKPLVTVTRHMQGIGDKDLKSRLGLKRRDEIGVLAGEFDRLTQRLDESRTKTLETAHRAGMAEIATGVLHNVGNAINTVNVNAELLAEAVKTSKVPGLEKAAALLKEQQPRLAEFAATDPRFPKLVDYLISLSGTLAQQQASMMEQIETLQGKVHHIRDIVSTQQAYAGAPEFRKEEDLLNLLEDALRINADLLDRQHVTVERMFSIVPQLPVNRVKLMQILTNLVKNAAEAIRETGRGSGRLVVMAAPASDGGAIVRITDDGVGIKPEHLKKSFSHGFTTKHDGHGFGLHYCANALTEMGGRITVESDGEGKGATFTVTLPAPDGDVEGEQTNDERAAAA
jgi:sensor domain CHASE-containing protein